MWSYIIDPKYLTWYQKLYLNVYSLYRYYFTKIYNDETLVYKDKGVKGYVRYKRRNIILHIKKRNKNRIFDRWDDEYMFF